MVREIYLKWHLLALVKGVYLVIKKEKKRKGGEVFKNGNDEKFLFLYTKWNTQTGLKRDSINLVISSHYKEKHVLYFFWVSCFKKECEANKLTNH